MAISESQKNQNKSGRYRRVPPARQETNDRAALPDNPRRAGPVCFASSSFLARSEQKRMAPSVNTEAFPRDALVLRHLYSGRSACDKLGTQDTYAHRRGLRSASPVPVDIQE
jgi:hypothetical protein